MLASSLGRLSTALQRHPWLPLSGLFEPSLASELVNELLSGVPRRVTVGAGDEMWDEYSVPPCSKLSNTLTSDAVLESINAMWGQTVRYTTRQWGQVYQVGQRIPWHTDGQGDIQLVLCLEPAPFECGGTLMLQTQEGEVALNLGIGDGLLFEATQLSHSTTPIIATAAIEQPRRVVAVSRFFIDV